MTRPDSPLAELTELVAPAWAVLRRRVDAIVLGVAVVATALAALALSGAAIDDAGIDAHRGVATAEVLDGSFARTLVRFPLANGQAVVPERGVFYPRGIDTGQTITVEYDLTDPEQVRVAGRTVLDGVLPALGGVAAVWLVLGPLAVWLRRRRARGPSALRSHTAPVDGLEQQCGSEVRDS